MEKPQTLTFKQQEQIEKIFNEVLGEVTRKYLVKFRRRVKQEVNLPNNVTIITHPSAKCRNTVSGLKPQKTKQPGGPTTTIKVFTRRMFTIETKI